MNHDIEAALLRAGRSEGPRREVRENAVKAALETTAYAAAGTVTLLGWLKGISAHLVSKAWLPPLLVSLVLAGGAAATSPRMGALVGGSGESVQARTKTSRAPSQRSPSREGLRETTPTRGRELVVRNVAPRATSLSTPKAPAPAPTSVETSALPSLVSSPSASVEVDAGAPEPSRPIDERVVMSEAREALQRGDATGALIRLYAHAANFPDSARGRERDYLRIRALVGAGRVAEAEGHAQRFVMTYPRGGDTDAVRALLPQVVSR